MLIIEIYTTDITFLYFFFLISLILLSEPKNRRVSVFSIFKVLTCTHSHLSDLLKHDRISCSGHSASDLHILSRLVLVMPQILLN